MIFAEVNREHDNVDKCQCCVSVIYAASKASRVRDQAASVYCFPPPDFFSLQAWPPSCYISINTTTNTRLCGDLKHMHKPKYLNLYAGH